MLLCDVEGGEKDKYNGHLHKTPRGKNKDSLSITIFRSPAVLLSGLPALVTCPSQYMLVFVSVFAPIAISCSPAVLPAAIPVPVPRPRRGRGGKTASRFPCGPAHAQKTAKESQSPCAALILWLESGKSGIEDESSTFIGLRQLLQIVQRRLEK